MKLLQTLCITLLALGLGTHTAQAGKARSLEDAYGKARDKAIMVYCYPANFNVSMEDHQKEFMKRRKLIKGLSGLTYLELPIFQNPDKKEKKEEEKALGKAGVPGRIYSLPCVIILDKDKNMRGFIRDGKTMESVELANKELKELIDIFEEQQKLLSKAERARHGKKGEYVAEAEDLGEGRNLFVPATAKAAAKAADTANKEGYADRNSLSFEEVLPDLDKTENNGEATQLIRGMMKRGKYSKTQQQELLCMLTGHLRRNGASKSELRALYQEMNKINPKSVYGAYAEECAKTYCTD